MQTKVILRSSRKQASCGLCTIRSVNAPVHFERGKRNYVLDF